MLHEPTIYYDFPLGEAAEHGSWNQANRYSIWVGKQTPDEPPYQLIEHHPQARLRLPLRSRLMRMIPAGTPFRLEHLFAPYRVSDADTIYVRAAMPDGVYHTLLAAKGRQVTQDQLVWFCPDCGAELERAPFDTAREGLVAFWPFLLENVRAFNAAADRRTCKACGVQHPICYGFDAKLDLPDEAAARANW
jgi:hypothetical protein